MENKDLKNILIKMKELQYNRDIEAAHCKADDLLVELISTLGDNNPIVEEIAEIYKSLEKWYA